jgi:hypothetical protein
MAATVSTEGVSDPLDPWQQRLIATVDRAIAHASRSDPLLYARLVKVRQQLTASR